MGGRPADEREARSRTYSAHPVICSDGCRLTVFDSGDTGEEGIVLIGPEPYSHRAWGPSMYQLAQFARVLLYDPRGRGQSSRLPGPYTVAQFASDLESVLRSRHVAPALLVGWSLGATVALRATASLRDSWPVLGIVNVDQPSRRLVEEGLLDQRIHDLRRSPSEHHQRSIKAYFGPESPPSESELASLLADVAVVEVDAQIEALRSSAAHDDRELLLTSQVPIRIHWAQYGSIDHAEVERWLRAGRDITATRFNSIGHMLPRARSSEFVADVMNFFQAVR